MFYKDNSKNRLMEVVSKLDGRDKSKLNENYENFHDTSVPPGTRPPQPLRPEGGPTAPMIDEEEEFVAHGSYTVSNAGGYEIMLNDAGDAVRVRDAFGSDNPQTSDWLEIEEVPNEEGGTEPVIDPNGYNIPLSHVMRIDNMYEGSKLEEENPHNYAPGGEEIDGVRHYGIKPFKGDDGRDRWITDEEWTELLQIRDAISAVLDKYGSSMLTGKWGFDNEFRHEFTNVMGKIHKAYLQKYDPTRNDPDFKI